MAQIILDSHALNWNNFVIWNYMVEHIYFQFGALYIVYILDTNFFNHNFVSVNPLRPELNAKNISKN